MRVLSLVVDFYRTPWLYNTEVCINIRSTHQPNSALGMYLPGERHAENRRGHGDRILKPHRSPCFEHAYRHQLYLWRAQGRTEHREDNVGYGMYVVDRKNDVIVGCAGSPEDLASAVTSPYFVTFIHLGPLEFESPFSSAPYPRNTKQKDRRFVLNALHQTLQ